MMMMTMPFPLFSCFENKIKDKKSETQKEWNVWLLDLEGQIFLQFIFALAKFKICTKTNTFNSVKQARYQKVVIAIGRLNPEQRVIEKFIKLKQIFMVEIAFREKFGFQPSRNTLRQIRKVQERRNHKQTKDSSQTSALKQGLSIGRLGLPCSVSNHIWMGRTVL